MNKADKLAILTGIAALAVGYASGLFLGLYDAGNMKHSHEKQVIKYKAKADSLQAVIDSLQGEMEKYNKIK